MPNTSRTFSAAGAAAVRKSPLAPARAEVHFCPQSPTGELRAAWRGRGYVELSNVHFCYPTRPDVEVLRGLSLSAAPGETIALVGMSGSGKSTVFHLLERFYEPQIGAVRVDGRSVALWEPTALRSTVAIVGQEPVLLSGTVAENILYGLVGRAPPGSAAFAAEFDNSPDESDEAEWMDMETGLAENHPLLGASNAPPAGAGAGNGVSRRTDASRVARTLRRRMIAAAKQANAYGFISRLPQGFDTPVGERGVQLSGGQRQRIAIARTLVMNPSVLLLDEATSALDASSEAVVQDALVRAMRGRTTLVIAHRLSTVRNADRIVVMSHGKIVETGSHDQLMAKGLRPGQPSYRALVQQQIFQSDRDRPDGPAGGCGTEA